MWKRKSKVDEDFALLHHVDDTEKPKRTRSRKNLCKRLFVVAVMLGLGLFCLGLLVWRPANRNPHYQLSKQTKTYDIIDIEKDKQMIEILRNDKIVEIERYDAGLAEKYICVLESGYQALMKPMEEWHYFERVVPTWDAAKIPRFRHNQLGRALNEYQGWGEVVGFYMDRALGWNRKPPVSGRLVSNKVLYSADRIFNGGWKKWLPEHFIPVSITIWMEKVQRASPALSIQQYLLHKSLKTSTIVVDIATMVSNKIVFDFLLDDHDSQATHNYIADSQGRLLHWDSGLAWRHGPYARTDCMDLFCGVVNWVELAKARGEPCQKICRFDTNTYHQLLSLIDGERSLGDSVMELMRDEPTFPSVNNGYFHIDTHDRKWAYFHKVSFTLQNYLDGIDERVKRTLQHIEDCISVHGIQHVIIHSNRAL